MLGTYVSLNGRLVSAADAVVSVDDIDFSYGYGVYETLKVRNRVVYFPERHEERLYSSAAIIGLEHTYGQGDLVRLIGELAGENRAENANVKVLLIGGDGPEKARLYIMTLAPLFPDRRDYRDGALALVWDGERAYPRAKALGMLVSTLAFRAARKAGAYDAILRNRSGELTEGTRTNLFYTDGERFFTPPASQVLEGVTRTTVIETMNRHGMEIHERPLHTEELEQWQGYFLSSTSTKIMPLKKLGSWHLGVPEIVRAVMRRYDEFLEAYAAGQPRLF